MTPTFPRTQRVTSASRLRLGALTCVATIGMLAQCGCKSMTELKRHQQDQVIHTEQRATEVQAESQQALTELDREQAELQRRARQLAARVAREERSKAAVAALSNGDPAAALGICDEILAANPLAPLTPTPAARDATSGRDTTSTSDAAPGTSGATGEPEADAAPPMEPSERARLHVVRGTALYDLGRVNEAIVAYQEAFALDPDFRTTRINLGKLLYQEQRYEEALEVWRHELADGYRSADLLTSIAQALWELSRTSGDPAQVEAARLALQGAMVERPSDVELQKWMAALEFETGRYEEALRWFDVILQRAPLDPTYLELLANCYLRMGRYEEAADRLELLARTLGDATPPAVCRTLGDLYARLRLPGAAARWFLRAYALDTAPVEADELLYVGSLLAEAGHTEEASAWLRKIPAERPEYAEGLARLAHLQVRGERLEEALTTLEEVRRLRPQDGLAHLTAGDLHLDRRAYTKALQAYGQASGLTETRGDGLAGLAEVAYAQGHLDDAIRYYRDAIQTSPEEPRYVASLRQIETEREARHAPTTAEERQSP